MKKMSVWGRLRGSSIELPIRVTRCGYAKFTGPHGTRRLSGMSLVYSMLEVLIAAFRVLLVIVSWCVDNTGTRLREVGFLLCSH